VKEIVRVSEASRKLAFPISLKQVNLGPPHPHWRSSKKIYVGQTHD
jgi:hypothetical protein